MGAIQNDWLTPLSPEFKKPYYAGLYKKIREEYSKQQIFPPADEIFTAFELTPLSEVKVVIIGQDPYHGEGQAHGLCFNIRLYRETETMCLSLAMIRILPNNHNLNL